MVDATNSAPRAVGGLAGRVIAGRYRIVGVVSTGATTLIADAVDLETEVPVTVKLLRPELAEGAEFRAHFRETAGAAARLEHPNIASVLDWGEVEADGRSTVFWVVEHLAGGSLRDLLDRGRLLSPSQALVVGLEACRALDAAHRVGELHTEITPSKLVFGVDRRLRIVDFGIARLLGQEMWKEPARVPTHVARYASPEQALGEAPDAKADTYALSLSLLEAVTGSVPFASDSTVSTLSARVGKLLPVSADLGSLAAVLGRAARPEPEDRSDASEFGQGLVQAAGSLPRPEPIPILSTGLFDSSELRRPTDPTGGFARPRDSGDDRSAGAAAGGAAVAAGGAAAASAAAAAAAAPAAGATAASGANGTPTAPPAGDPMPVPGATATSDTASAPPAAPTPQPTPDPAPPSSDASAPAADAAAAERDPGELLVVPLDADDAGDGAASNPTEQLPAEADAAEAPEVYDEERRPRFARTLLIIVLVLAGIGALAYAGWLQFRTQSHEVPELTGVTESVALAEIDGNDWVIIRSRERDDDFPEPGTVIRTEPVAGVVLDEGEEFTMVVSDGAEFRTLPEFSDLPVEEALEEAGELGLIGVELTRRRFSENVPDGAVIRWSVVGDEDLTAGSQILPNETVEFVVSKGPQPREVPDLVNVTLEGASAAVEGLQLRFEQRREVFSDSVEPGRIVAQVPDPGTTVPRGARVRVDVSKGPDVVFLPDVEGLRYQRATRILEREGFVIGDVLGTTEGRVVSTSVDGNSAEAGEIYRRGTTIDIVSL